MGFDAAIVAVNIDLNGVDQGDYVVNSFRVSV